MGFRSSGSYEQYILVDFSFFIAVHYIYIYIDIDIYIYIYIHIYIYIEYVHRFFCGAWGSALSN